MSLQASCPIVAGPPTLLRIHPPCPKHGKHNTVLLLLFWILPDKIMPGNCGDQDNNTISNGGGIGHGTCTRLQLRNSFE